MPGRRRLRIESIRRNVAAVTTSWMTGMTEARLISIQPRHAAGSQSTASLLDFPADPIRFMRALHREHGDFAIVEENGQRLAFVFSPELNRQVLSNSQVFHSQFFAIRGGRRSAQRRVTAGLLSQNGTQHRDMRRVLKDVFEKRVLPKYLGTICRLSVELVDAWTPGSRVDLNSSMVEFMLGMTSALLFGQDDRPFANRLGQLIDRWVRQNHQVGMGALVSSPEFSRRYEELLEMASELESLVQDMFQRQRSAGSSQTNVLSLLLNAQASGHGLADQDLVGQTTLLFAAAHLTTAHTLSWTLFLLSQHPDTLQRLQEELNTHVTSDVPGVKQLENLRFLDCVIRESMRVLPASSYSQRITSEPTEIAGVRLETGTPVIFSQFITHHRHDLYDQPNRFLPERWLHITPSPYEYLPFGAGPRMCIGAPLAMMELRAALAVILRRYNFQIQPDSAVDGRVVSTMLGPTSPIEAVVTAAEQLPTTASVHGSVHELVELPNASQQDSCRRAA
jgi:cytochrome P450